MASAATAVTLRIPARAEYVGLCRLALAGIASGRQIDAEDQADLKLILTEAASNAVRHAYEDRTGQIAIHFELFDDRLAVEVVDAGQGLAEDAGIPSSPPSPERFEEDEEGLGLALIKMLSDEFTIGRTTEEGGTSARFVKYLRSRSGEEQTGS